MSKLDERFLKPLYVIDPKDPSRWLFTCFRIRNKLRVCSTRRSKTYEKQQHRLFKQLVDLVLRMP